MLLLTTVAATLAALGGAQALPPCVPSDDSTRMLAAANLGDEESCCVLSTGFASCAAPAGDDGIVIDLTDLGTAESGPLALAVLQTDRASLPMQVDGIEVTALKPV